MLFWYLFSNFITFSPLLSFWICHLFIQFLPQFSLARCAISIQTVSLRKLPKKLRFTKISWNHFPLWQNLTHESNTQTAAMSLDVYSLHIIVHVYFTATRTRTATSYKCVSKQNAWSKAQFFSYLSMVWSWSHFSMSPDFLKTMKLQIMKKMSKQNTKKGSTVLNRIECTLCMFML